MQRISVIFEQRFTAVLDGMLTEKEKEEIDYELAPTIHPQAHDDGTVGLSMGMSVSLSMPAISMGDHVMVSGLVQDPYANDTTLTMNAKELLAELRERQASSGTVLGSKLIIPGR